MKAFLILADGHIFEGKSIGARKEIISELVFNTSMTGYLEVLTDPSYAGQTVCMTYPLIGNYGICHEDEESIRPWLDGYIVRELSKTASNFRCEDTLSNYLKRFDITGICGIDTRQLTKILRENGTMNCMITTDENYNLVDIMPKLKEYTTGHVVEKVTCSEKYMLYAEKEDAVQNLAIAPQIQSGNSQTTEKNQDSVKNVALLDLGAKKNIAKSLAKRGCNVTIYPATTKAEEILAKNPDGIMLSNGPGDPAVCTDMIAEIKKLYASDIPIFAICLGHQLMALATGAKTKKMKYGHRGGNHPVKDLETGRVYISSQNHGYVVDTDTIDNNIAAPAFVNVNDGTNEGLKYIGKNIFTVQFHPEACPGPQDSAYLFDRFIDMMGGQENA
ncbi:MAG: carbamoyl phosphate synthase small subunit [Clostridium sp.]|nr:carbamoyl phosphate synthase small subunit [Clostridium sp.]MCM1207951.1 carbamoyl phosphate synthase small subunit [Ruminococcus sp.]